MDRMCSVYFAALPELRCTFYSKAYLLAAPQAPGVTRSAVARASSRVLCRVGVAYLIGRWSAWCCGLSPAMMGMQARDEQGERFILHTHCVGLTHHRR